jgi:undecaprenyl-diphosphatase
MTWWQALLLGLVQGLTEFLPVSSSGHLELTKALFGNAQLPEESLTFTVVVHFATALSTLVVFRNDVTSIVAGLASGRKEDVNFSFKIILSMLPAAFVGVLFDEQIEALFDGQILLVGAMLVITGLLLFLADRAKRTEKNVTYKDAFIIGLSQAIAILPGISRSGATVSTSVLLGIDRERAARFSFLMVVPLILGKMAKDVIDGGLVFTGEAASNYLIGFAAAFIAGWAACKWMIALVKKAQLKYFAYYCFVVGAVALVWVAVA